MHGLHTMCFIKTPNGLKVDLDTLCALFCAWHVGLLGYGHVMCTPMHMACWLWHGPEHYMCSFGADDLLVLLPCSILPSNDSDSSIFLQHLIKHVKIHK